MRIPSNLLVFNLAPAILAAHLRIYIPPTTVLPHPNALPASTYAILTTLGHIFSAPLRADNTFDFRNLTSGSYLLDVHSHTYNFSPLRVDVQDGLKVIDGGNGILSSSEVQVFGTFRGNEWSNKGEVIPVEEITVGVWGFEVKASGSKEYFIQKSGFSPLSLLKNPMILIAGASMIIVFGMPYLMDNMDPEMRAEFEERQKSSPLTGNPAANPLQNFDAAAWLSGANKRTEAAPVKRGESVEGAITR